MSGDALCCRYGCGVGNKEKERKQKKERKEEGR